MDSIKNIITGGIITLVVGGAAFTFSQEAVIDNFAKDTGLTQEQAEQYVNNIPEDELVSFDELGENYISAGEDTLEYLNSIDCDNYEYEWESATLPCATGKAQLRKTGNTEKLVGQGFIALSSDSATKEDMSAVIGYLDQLNSDYSLEISRVIYGKSAIDEFKKTNSYNKSLLKAALESD